MIRRFRQQVAYRLKQVKATAYFAWKMTGDFLGIHVFPQHAPPSYRKITIITPYSPRAVTGIGSIVTTLKDGLSRWHDVTVLTLPVENPVRDVDVVEVEADYPEHLQGVGVALEMVKRLDADVVNVHQAHVITALVSLWCWFNRIPVVATFHMKPRPTNPIRWGLDTFWEWVVYLTAKEVVFVSEGSRNDYGYRSGDVIHNAVDRAFIGSLKKRDRFRLLYAGRITEDKGIFEVLKAVRMLGVSLEDQTPLLMVAGKDETGGRFMDYVREHDLEQFVLYLGELPFRELPNLYDRSSMLFLPSRYEGLPMVVLEAMARGVVPVVMATGGMTEAVQDRENGIVISDESPALEMASCIVWFMVRPEELAVLSANAKRTVEERFVPEVMVARYDRKFAEAVA